MKSTKLKRNNWHLLGFLIVLSTAFFFPIDWSQSFLLILDLAILLYLFLSQIENSTVLDKCTRFFNTLSFVIVALLAILYFFIPAFYEHLEATIGAISWLGFNGKDLYVNSDDVNVYTTAVGPLSFHLNTIFYYISPSFNGTKVAGLLFIPGLLLGVKIFYRHTRSFYLSMLVMSIFAYTSILDSNNFFFSNRPDTWIFVITILSLLVRDRFPSFQSAMIISVLCGVCTNLKINGGIHLLPLIFFDNRLVKLRPFIILLLSGFMALILTGMMNFNFDQYALYLKMVLHATQDDGMDMRAHLPLTLQFVFMVLMPYYPILKNKKKYLGHLFFVGFSTFLLIITSSKVGSSFYHMNLLFLVAVYSCVVVLKDEGEEEVLKQPGVKLFLSALLIVLFSFSIIKAPIIRFVVDGLTIKKEVYARINLEIDRVFEKYSNNSIGLGMSNSEGYYLNFYRVRFLMHKIYEPYIDPVSLMSTVQNGISFSEATLSSIKNCHTDMWLIPKHGGKPWTQQSWYASKARLFSSDFIHAFHTAYKSSGQTKYFTIYKCRKFY